MPAVRAVAFDFNGTLSNDEALLCSIYRELFAEQGRPLAPEEYYGELAGHSEEAIVGGWLGVSGVELESLVAERIARYRTASRDGHTIGDAVRRAVEYASARVPVAVVSGAYRAEIRPVLESAGLMGAVRLMVTADDVTNGKPHPESYQRLVRLLPGDIPPEAVLVFEDTEAGVAAATSAGCRCVALAGTAPPARLGRAEEIVESIDVALLERLLA